MMPVDDPRTVLYENKNGTRSEAMRALFEARLKHPGRGDIVEVECVCGHTERLTAGLLTTAGVKPFQLILDLQFRLRCRSAMSGVT
jgi:hypothetical protein